MIFNTNKAAIYEALVPLCGKHVDYPKILWIPRVRETDLSWGIDWLRWGMVWVKK